MISDFYDLARSGDDAIIGRFQFYVRNTRKRIFPKSVQYNACKVEREPQRLTVRLLDTTKGQVPETTAFYRFIPTPDFSRGYVQT